MTSSPILILVVAAGLAGCANPGGRALPVCDGKHLRLANPHGSVLAPAVPVAASVNAPEPAAQPGNCGQ